MKQEGKKLKIICLIVSVLIIFFSSILFYQIINNSSNNSTPESVKKETDLSQDRKKENILNSIIKASLISPFNDKQKLNILILGRPGQGYSGQDLTDTIILAHLEPKNKKAVLISLPRDLLVKNNKNGYLTKINSLYSAGGIEILKEKVEEISGLPIDYYILIDLKVAEEVINLVDGLNVYVPQDINDPYFPGPNYSYQDFNLSAGWRYLDGETALKYIRTRYTSPNGDFDRMARQQQIIYLLKQKVLTYNLLWDLPTYLKIFNTLKDNIETDLGILEIKSLWGIAKEIKPEQIDTLVIDKKETDLLIGGQTLFGNQIASVVYPKNGRENYDEIKNYIQKAVQGQMLK